MALDYDQSAKLRTNIVFQGRIASAALVWAQYKLAAPVDVTQPVKRREFYYAEGIVANANQKAATLQPIVVQDGSVQGADIDATDGDSTITDAALQTAVETAIGKLV
jgi:hypothetical protein